MTTVMDSAMDSAKSALGDAKGAAEGAAVIAKDTVGDAAKMIKKAVGFLRHFNVDDALGLIGRPRRLSALEALALVGGGAVLGAGFVFFFTPVTGQDARRHVGAFVEALGGRAFGAAKSAEHKAEELADQIKDTLVGAAKDTSGDVKTAQKQGAASSGRAGPTERGAVGAGDSAEAGDPADDGKGRRLQDKTIQVS